MPITFLAHQAPVMALSRRWPGKIDGVALAIGSMSPDFAYVFVGTRLAFWAHTIPAIVWFCVPVTLVVSWLVVRLLAPVVPDHLPAGGPFRLRDYRGLATHRFTLVGTTFSAAFGAWTHVVLDVLTHNEIWYAMHLPWYTRPIGPWVIHGSRVSLLLFGTWGCHVGLSGLSVWLLARWGRRGWLHQRAARIERFPVTSRSWLTLWGTTAAVGGVTVAVVCDGLWRSPIARSVLVLRFAGALFASLCLGAVITRTSVSGGRDVTRV